MDACRNIKAMASKLAAPNPAQTAPQPTKLRQGFVALAEALLKSLCEVFPEDDSLDTGLHLFTNLVKGDPEKEDRFIRKCHEVFQEHAAAFKTRDEEALFAAADALPILKDVDIRGKWSDAGFDAESKEHLWQYVQSLKLYSELFCAVPSAVMGKIESVASDLGERLKSGQLDLGNINIGNIGKELLGQLSQEELRSFEGNLPGIYSSITDMATTLAKHAGHQDLDVDALMKNVLDSQSGLGNVDVGAIMQRIGGLAHPGGGFDPQQMMDMAKQLGPVLAQMAPAPAPALGDAPAPVAKKKKRR